MEFGTKVSIFILLIFVFCGEKTLITACKCHFPAIFNFGDSNSDTGGAYVLFNAGLLPNGMTLGKSFKRGCDGLLIIDFLAESLGLPYLNYTMDLNGTSFRYGANFAVAGNMINPDGGKEHHLDKQVSQFFDFKSRAIASKEPESTKMYPNPEVYSEALYTIDIGQNDVNGHFGWKPVPTILGYFTNSVKRLLNGGAKYLWIHNTGPLGCVPHLANGCPSEKWNCTLDRIGCKVELNAMSQDFNSKLKEAVYKLREEYPVAVITLVDIYSAKYKLISDNKCFDKELKFKYCCGNNDVWCSLTATVNNKTVFGGACKDPSKYISWDGVHYTQAANKIIANQIINGDLSEPRVALSHACRKGKN